MTWEEREIARGLVQLRNAMGQGFENMLNAGVAALSDSPEFDAFMAAIEAATADKLGYYLSQQLTANKIIIPAQAYYAAMVGRDQVAIHKGLMATNKITEFMRVLDTVAERSNLLWRPTRRSPDTRRPSEMLYHALYKVIEVLRKKEKEIQSKFTNELARDDISSVVEHVGAKLADDFRDFTSDESGEVYGFAAWVSDNPAVAAGIVLALVLLCCGCGWKTRLCMMCCC